MADWTTLTYAVLDVEGNGRHPPDLVELAIVPITNGTIGDPLTWLLHPDEPITPIASRIHGIRNADVVTVPTFATVQDDVTAALDGAVIVAHNAHVDISLVRRKLGNHWEPGEVFDTLKLTRRLLPGLPSYRLGALVETLALAEGLPEGLTPHRATYDALVTARLFTRLAAPPDQPPRPLMELRDPGPAGPNPTTTLF